MGVCVCLTKCKGAQKMVPTSKPCYETITSDTDIVPLLVPVKVISLLVRLYSRRTSTLYRVL